MLPSRTKAADGAHLVVRFCGILVLLFSVVGMASGLGGWPVLTSFFKNAIPMALSTASLFCLSGIVLISRWIGALPVRLRPVAAALAFLVMAFGLISALEPVMRLPPDFDPLDSLFARLQTSLSVTPVAMSPVTGLLFSLSGFSLLVGGMAALEPPGIWCHVSGIAGALVALSSMTLFLGYIYGTPFLYNTHFIPVSASTSLAFVFTGCGGMFSAGAECLPLRPFMGHSVRATLLRVLTPALFLMFLVYPIVLKVMELSLHINSAALGSILAMTCAGSATVVVYRVGTKVRNQLAKSEEQRNAAEKVVEESERKFRKLFEQANVGVALIDGDTFRFIEVNNKCCELFGRGMDEMRGVYLQGIVHHDDIGACLDGLSRIGDESGDEFTMEVRCVRADGYVVWINLTVTSVWLSEGMHRQHIAVFQDITGRKKAEEARSLALTNLEIKNVELEQVIYVASHDLRSPLVNIEGYGKELEYAVEELNRACAAQHGADYQPPAIARLLKEDIPEALRFIRTSASKMDGLLNGLLRLSRSGRAAIRIEILDMDALVEKIMVSTDFRIRQANVRVEVSTLPPCLGDAIQVNQVFSNLLDNALKYLDPGRPGLIRITGRTQENCSVYCVEDNGIGVAPHHVGKIFEIFHRLDPSRGEGEGLGLTIVQRILARLDGSIRVESEVGAGSRFYVTLPAVRPQ